MNMKAVLAFLQKHRKPLLFAVVGAALVWAVMSGEKKEQSKEGGVKGKGNITTEEQLRSEIEGMKKAMEDMKKKLPEKPVETPAAGPAKASPEKVKSLEELERIVGPRTPPHAAPTKQVFPPLTPAGAPGAQPQLPAPKPEPRLLKIDVSEITQPAKAAEKTSQASRSADLYLPAGSFASFTLLSGTYAPETGEQMPVSGVIDKAYVGPNKSSIPLKGCFFLGKAQGNTGEKVAAIKPVKLSCVWPDGKSFDADIAGYVTDVSGNFGLKGEVERHGGDFFATVGITSFLEGFTQGLAKAQETQSAVAGALNVSPSLTNITGNPLLYGAMQGGADFAKAAKTFFGSQIQSLVPSVVVKAGEKGYLYMAQGVTITGGGNAIASTANYYDPYNTTRTR